MHVGIIVAAVGAQILFTAGPLHYNGEHHRVDKLFVMLVGACDIYLCCPTVSELQKHDL